MKAGKKVVIISMLIMGVPILSGYAKPMADTQIMQTLTAMESPAEDMLDAIDSKDMHQLTRLYHKISIAMDEVNKRPGKNNIQNRQIAMLNSWFDLVSLEMKEADDFPALANAINQFSGQLIISTQFDYTYQKGIAWMDYLGRDLLLLNKYPNQSAHHDALIKARKAELNRTWEHIKFILDEHGGIKLANKVDPTIQSILKESDPDKLVTLSMTELDLVDDIESFFHIN